MIYPKHSCMVKNKNIPHDSENKPTRKNSHSTFRHTNKLIICIRPAVLPYSHLTTSIFNRTALDDILSCISVTCLHPLILVPTGCSRTLRVENSDRFPACKKKSNYSTNSQDTTTRPVEVKFFRKHAVKYQHK